mgnify:CR=1 FL=1
MNEEFVQRIKSELAEIEAAGLFKKERTFVYYSAPARILFFVFFLSA